MVPGAVQQHKVKSNAGVDFPASNPVQETENSLELSRMSIISSDCVPFISVPVDHRVEAERLQVQHKFVCKQSSYSPVDTKLIKILVVGDRFTGKSSLMQRITTTGFSCQYITTHFLNCSCKTVRHNEELYSVLIWELTENTLVEEKYFKECCSGAMAAFVVYDLSRLNETLASIADWKKRINNTVCKRNGNPIPIYLLGNKCDLEGCQKDGSNFVKLHKFTDHFRTSAKTGKGIEEAVRAAVKEILKDTYPHPPEVCETPIHHKVQ